MKINKLSTLTLLGTLSFASQFVIAGDIKFNAASSETGAFSWDSTTDTAPWIGGTLPGSNYADTITWDGITKVGDVDVGTDGYILYSSSNQKITSLNFSENVKGKTLNFIFTKSNRLFINGLNNNGLGGKIKFYAKDGVSGTVNPATSYTDWQLNTAIGNNPFVIEFGKGITVDMQYAPSQFSFINDKFAGSDNLTKGQIIFSEGADFSATNNRLNINSASTANGYNDGMGTHRDIIIGEGSDFSVKTLAVYHGVGITVNGTLTASATIFNDLLTIDLGKTAEIDFGTISDGYIGGSAEVCIYDFRNDAIAFSTESSKILGNVEAQFKRWDATAEDWVADLTVKDGYLYSAALAVPEPAEWAVIFGGIALALAIYRRRK